MMMERLKSDRTKMRRNVGILRTLVPTAVVVAFIAFSQTVAPAFASSLIGSTEIPQTQVDATTNAPSHNLAQRIKLIARVTREVTLGEPITSAIVLEPAIATVEIKGDRTALITGLMTGETILILSGKNTRITYALDVERPPQVSRSKDNEGQKAAALGSTSGSNSIYFTPGSSGVPSLLRESFDYRNKLAGNRTLRMNGEMSRYFGGGERALALVPAPTVATNRLQLGLDSPTLKLDLLDSPLEISSLGSRGFQLRGPHLISTRDSRWRGLELFAGNASPQLTLFDRGEGRVAGGFMPIIEGKSLRVRSGFILVAPHRKTGEKADVSRGGLVLHTDARYTPSVRTTIEGETDLANGGLSWRAKLNLLRGAFNLSGELSEMDRHSPIIAIGAQPGGNTTSTFSLQWLPVTRFSASASYYRTTTAPVDGVSGITSANRIQLNSSAFLISTSYRPTQSASLSLSITQQKVDAPASTGSYLLNLNSRNIVVKYDQNFNRRWANRFEAGLIHSREANFDAQMNRGTTLREQLRFGWTDGSVTGFVNYRSNTPSLEGLILRNPGLLPFELRAAFAADPIRFLLTNREALPLILSGVQLPITNNKESGVRVQSANGRLNISSEIVYSAGRFIATDQRTLLTSHSANIRLDAANSLQVNLSRGFAFSGTGTRTSISLGYVHRFGAGSGGGFQFASLLGLDRGHVRGRVFEDLNGNGQEDSGEGGIAGMTVRLDGKRSVVTDSRGDFNFGSLEPADFEVQLISDDLGVKLRASTMAQQHVFVSALRTVNLSFGLTSSGFAAGHVFNDLQLTGEQSAGDQPGLSGVTITLQPSESVAGIKPLIQTVDGNGLYEFRNVRPGNYILAIDPATVPANFRLPQTQWPITIDPLQGVYLDLPLAAQRAVSGTVYMDFDGNGKFTPDKDTPIPGAHVRIGKAEAITDSNGAYMLRNIVAGKAEIRATTTTGYSSHSTVIELPAAPTLIREMNLPISRSEIGNN